MGERPSVPSNRQQLSGYISPAMAAAPLVGPVPADTELSMIVSLPLRDPHGLSQKVKDVSEPKSREFRRYLTPKQVGERYGAAPESYAAVVAWAKSYNLTVETHPNLFAMMVKGRVGDVEQALGVHFNYARRSDGTQFREPDREPSVALDVPLAHIDNLDDFVVLKPDNSMGYGPGGTLEASDLRAAYLSCGSPTGVGQYIGIFTPGSQSCYSLADLNAYEGSNGLFGDTNGGTIPAITSVNLAGQPAGTNPTCPQGVYPTPPAEGILDITMAMAMAPMATLELIGGTPEQFFYYMSAPASNGQLILQGSISYPIIGALGGTGIAYLDELAAQGQSIVVSSGDTGAYSTTNSPTEGQLSLDAGVEQAVTMVGATQLTMSHEGGLPTYGSEIAWSHSGGGAYSNSVYPPGLPMPTYQSAAGINWAGNGGSATYRNVPDVSIAGQFIFQCYLGTCTTCSGGICNPVGGGTSASAPLFAGLLALANELAASDGYNPVGFANPALYYEYSQGGGEGVSYNDILSGGPNKTSSPGCNFDAGTACVVNQGYNAVTGYDLISGLGSPKCELMKQLAYLEGSVQWEDENQSGSCFTEVAGSAGAVQAWAIGCNSSIWQQVNGSWTQAGGAAVHVSVDSNDVPWVLNSAGAVFQLQNGSGAYCTSRGPGCEDWVVMNQSGNTGPHNHLSSFAAGPNGTGWATSTTQYGSGSDYTIYNFAGGGPTGTWNLMPGGGRQIAESTGGAVWLRNYANSLFYWNGSAWIVVTMPPPLANGYGVLSPTWIAVAPDNNVWMVSDMPWQTGSNDHAVFQMVQFNSAADIAWSLLPGGATQISVSGFGTPWATNSEHVAFELETVVP